MNSIFFSQSVKRIECICKSRSHCCKNASSSSKQKNGRDFRSKKAGEHQSVLQNIKLYCYLFLRPPEPMNVVEETLPCFKALQYFFHILLLRCWSCYFLRPPEPMNVVEETLLCFKALQYFFHILFLRCWSCHFLRPPEPMSVVKKRCCVLKHCNISFTLFNLGSNHRISLGLLSL